MKQKIKEIIIVEGRDDTNRLKEVLDCDTIETNGSAINKRTLGEIATALETRGAIVFTDPDYPGQRIRSIIVDRFPNIKEAHLSKKKARGARGKIGIEHAKREDILEALELVVTRNTEEVDLYSIADMVEMKLTGQSDAKERRHYLSEKLNIGYANASQMRNKLNRYRIDKARVFELLEAYEGEQE